jgi:hypothetical protein
MRSGGTAPSSSTGAPSAAAKSRRAPASGPSPAIRSGTCESAAASIAYRKPFSTASRPAARA